MGCSGGGVCKTCGAAQVISRSYPGADGGAKSVAGGGRVGARGQNLQAQRRSFAELQSFVNASGLPFATLFTDKSVLEEQQPAFIRLERPFELEGQGVLVKAAGHQDSVYGVFSISCAVRRQTAFRKVESNSGQTSGSAAQTKGG